MKAFLNVVLVVAILSVVFAAPVLAVSGSNYRAHLAGRNEVPAVETLAQGQAIFMVNGDETMISYKLIVANIEDVVQAHIHLGPADANGPVVAFLFGPASLPGRFSGVLAEGTITAGDLVGPLAGQPLTALLDAIRAGNTYVNVHTVENPAGEVRGQIR